MNLEILREIGIINTLRFNWKYFKWGMIKPKVICSRNVILDKLDGKVKISNPAIGGIKIGFGHVGIIDGKREKTIWQNCGTIRFVSHVRLDIGTRIVCSMDGVLSIGEDVQITGRSSVICYKEISIGNNCLISWDNLLMDTDFHKIYLLTDVCKKKINNNDRILIGNHVWIGCRCMVLKGATIPDNSVISAGSIITRKHDTPIDLFVGNKVNKNSIGWEA